MSELDKRHYMYKRPCCLSPFASDLIDAQEATRKAAKECIIVMRQCAAVNNNAVMAYLLELGVPVPMGDMGLLGVAATLGDVAMVHVLRRFPPFDGNWAIQTLAELAITDTDAFVQQLRDTVATNHRPYHCYGSVYALDDFKDWHGALADGVTEFRPTAVRASWPPSPLAPSPPLPEAIPLHLHAARLVDGVGRVPKIVSDLWDAVGNQRREEAKGLAPYNWRRLRRAVRMRAIYFYWLGLTQETQCAADGAGRRADKAAYVEDGW